MRFSRREFLTFTGLGTALAFAEPFLAACAGIVGKPTKEISPTTPPLPDLTPTSEIDQQGGVNVARVQLTETAMGGEITGKANLEVIKRALSNFGFEDGALEKGQVALWSPIESEKLLMYKVHKDTTEMFSIGRLYAYHTKAQRFLEVPVLLRADLGADGSFLLKSVEAVSLDINTSEAKKRTYAVRTATLKVLDDEKKTVEFESDPTIAPRFSYDIESTIDGQNKPIIVGTRKYALGMFLADLKGSQINGDTAYANEAIFRRFVIPAQELGTFKEQPALLRESSVSNVTQDEIATLLADKKLSNSKVVSLSVEQWGGSTISSKDAAIVFTPDLTSDVVQTTSDAEKHKLQGKYFLAVKAPKKIGNSTDKIKTVSLSKQDDEWQLIEFPLQLVTRDNGNTYLELINDTFGVRLAVGVKVVDKKIQVLGDQLFAYAFSPAKMETQTSPLQVFGGELQKMLGGMKEVEIKKDRAQIVFEKDIFLTGDEQKINDVLSQVTENRYPIGGSFLSSSKYFERRAQNLNRNIVLLACKVTKDETGHFIANYLYLFGKLPETNVLGRSYPSSKAFFFKLSVPLENTIVQDSSSFVGVNSIKGTPDDQLKTVSQYLTTGKDFQNYILLTVPATKEISSGSKNDSAIFPLTSSYATFVKSQLTLQDFNSSPSNAQAILEQEFSSFSKDHGVSNGDDVISRALNLLKKDWLSLNEDVLDVSSTLPKSVFVEPYILPKSSK